MGQESGGFQHEMSQNFANAAGDARMTEGQGMDKAVQHALEHDRTIDITTRGRQTGQLRITEIWFHNIDGELYITGTPGRRDWYANLVACPEFTFHLKQSMQADLPARATPITEPVRRRAIMARIHQKLGGNRDLDAWVEGSPLVQVELLDA
jgi:hypothetical protein